MNFFRGASDVDGAIAIHGEGKVAVGLAFIDVGVCGGEDDPIGPRAGKGLRDGLGFADVGIFRTEPGDGVGWRFAHKRVADQAGGAEESDSHDVWLDFTCVGEILTAKRAKDRDDRRENGSMQARKP
jgi:hypothetical protein